MHLQNHIKFVDPFCTKSSQNTIYMFLSFAKTQKRGRFSGKEVVSDKVRDSTQENCGVYQNYRAEKLGMLSFKVRCKGGAPHEKIRGEKEGYSNGCKY